MRTSLFSLFLLLATSVTVAQTCPTSLYRHVPESFIEIDNNNKTIKDKRTGLTWYKCLSGTVEGCDSTPKETTFIETESQIKSLNATSLAGINTWRLPNVKEMASIIEYACYQPALNLSMLPTPMTEHVVWTSTAFPDYSERAIVFYMEDGTTGYYSKVHDTHKAHFYIVSDTTD